MAKRKQSALPKIEPVEEGTLTSGAHKTPWTNSHVSLRYGPLKEGISVDVAIVGAGIAGMSIAYHLAREGKRVAVLEDGVIGSGETGRTTAHLTWVLDDRFFNLERFHERLRLAGESHQAAIRAIEQNVKAEGIACDFERVEGYLILHHTHTKELLERELEVIHKLGFKQVRMAEQADAPFTTGPCLRFPSQAQFHPLKYLAGLARSIVQRKGMIFTQTHVTEVREDGVTTSAGHRVQAKHVVVATNSPINDRFGIHTKQAPYRTYVIAGKVRKGTVPRVLIWDTGDPYHYVRIHNMDAKHDLLIVGGEDHKTGQQDNSDVRYARLESWARSRYPLGEVMYRWSGQVMEPADGMAFIGKSIGEENIFVHTGDSGNGITHGAIGGLLITDLIVRGASPWEKLYDPKRKIMTKELVKENVNVIKQYADYLIEGDVESASRIPKGEGAILREGATKVAAFKDERGEMHLFSAVCPHLGCIVRWNSGEKTFDCPCHGSRFTCLGKVINGPANRDLEPKEIVLEQR